MGSFFSKTTNPLLIQNFSLSYQNACSRLHLTSEQEMQISYAIALFTGTLSQSRYMSGDVPQGLEATAQFVTNYVENMQLPSTNLSNNDVRNIFINFIDAYINHQGFSAGESSEMKAIFSTVSPDEYEAQRGYGGQY